MTPRHDPDAQRFTLELDGETAYVNYSPDPSGDADHDVVFSYVFVPPAHRGRGVNHALLNFAFEHARQHGWTVRPTCTYIANAWVPRHPEVHDVLAV